MCGPGPARPCPPVTPRPLAILTYMGELDVRLLLRLPRDDRGPEPMLEPLLEMFSRERTECPDSRDKVSAGPPSEHERLGHQWSNRGCWRLWSGDL